MDQSRELSPSDDKIGLKICCIPNPTTLNPRMQILAKSENLLDEPRTSLRSPDYPVSETSHVSWPTALPVTRVSDNSDYV